MNMSYILSVDTVRDDRRGVRLWTGATAPAWGSVGYAERGRSVFAVQTGMITFPILDFLSLIGESGRPDLVPVEVASGLRDMALEALSFHDPQWKDGPLEDEGHYVGRDQEERFEDKPLPANRQSAMGRAQWAAYRVTGDQDYRRRAVAIGRYLKRRLFVARDGACYWNFVLPKEPIRGVFPRERIKGEDISHGALSASLPLLLHSGGEVFTDLDMVRMGRTVTRGFGRLGDGVLFGDITGSPVSDPSYVSVVTRWIGFSRFVPDVRRLIWEFHLSYVRQPDPYDLAMLITCADPQHSTGMRLAVGAGVDDAVRILYCSGKPDRVTNCDGQRLARQTGREEE